MDSVSSRSGVRVSYERSGRGPALVLVHGAFSDHHTNWEFVAPILHDSFTLYAVARRGRGETPATVGHTLEDEVDDVTAVVAAIGEPVFLLGHSYGAHCALGAAARVPEVVRRLVLYEPAWPSILSNPALARLEALAAAGDWDEFSMSFFRDTLFVPVADLEALRKTELWPPIVADARASLGDLRALKRHDFSADRYRQLAMPVLLQVGSESPRDLYVTDALAAVLPNAHVGVLEGQAHEGMTTAPGIYAESIARFLAER